MNNDITYFAKTNFRGQEHVFGIKTDDRRRHVYVIGKTGMGKTNMLENMIISDVIGGNGVAVVDPHGDLAEEVLNFVPSSRINDVVYFNPADIDYPIAFNVMEQVDPKYRHLVCSGLIGVFKKIWADSWGPRLEYLLRNAILGLLEYPGSTLLGVPRMLVDKDYRKKVVAKITDPVVKAFWVNEFTKYSNQFMVDAISPIQNKVGQFLSSALVRNIVSQPNSTIDVREIMDNKKILIINLAKGKIGEDYSALLGAMLITKIQLAAMGRADIPEQQRKDFYLYVDEFQNFATESFAGILSEARKYRLNLIVAHQYIGQLEEEVRDAIFGNVGTIITFRVGAADAEFLEKEFEPVFTMNDLVNLPKYEIYLKLMIDGVAGDAFSATTLPPMELPENKSNAEKIIKVSRERYAKQREAVEEKITKWSGMDVSGEEMAEQMDSGGKRDREEYSPRGEKRDDRVMWDAVCETCGESIKVPFKPDPLRKTYCKNCLAILRKQMSDNVRPGEKRGEAPVREPVRVERSERPDRSERPERYERSERPERYERQERPERREAPESREEYAPRPEPVRKREFVAPKREIPRPIEEKEEKIERVEPPKAEHRKEEAGAKISEKPKEPAVARKESGNSKPSLRVLPKILPKAENKNIEADLRRTISQIKANISSPKSEPRKSDFKIAKEEAEAPKKQPVQAKPVQPKAEKESESKIMKEGEVVKFD